MITSKEQELEALEKIREIVDGLGENSYIGTALKGTLEDAKTNIYNDWGCSMYDRWQSAENDLDNLRAIAHEAEEKSKDEIAILKSEIDTLKKKVIPDDDLRGIHKILSCKINDLREEVSDLEKDIINYCDQPNSDAFIKAVSTRKKKTKLIEEIILLGLKVSNVVGL